MNSATPKPREISGTTAASAAATETTLQVASDARLVRITRVMIKHTAGSAANFTPLIGNASGFTGASTNQKFTGGNTAVAALFDQAGRNDWCTTDANGRLYLRPAPNTGADNVFSYVITMDVY